jgi:hypothetical protein
MISRKDSVYQNENQKIVYFYDEEIVFILFKIYH